MTNRNASQNSINIIWNKIWASQDTDDIVSIFKHRLFIEGYPVFKKYIPSNAVSILDLGSGTGRYGVQIAKDFPMSKIIISDILDESILIINKLIKDSGAKNAKSQKEDALNLSFADNTLDFIFCDVVIQHIPDYHKAITEMTRVLKPGGRVIVSVMNYWNFPHTLYKLTSGKKYEYGYEKSYTKKELRKLMYENNLKVIAEDGFYFAYGVFRLKRICRAFSLIGRLINRFTTIIDKFTNRFISKNFGFEILIVAEKQYDSK